ncbi:hypothetical protein C8Q80DRAFT_264579 [Daedaleopsis nitida]|nr:hypothetical protein C8Q80DRAFT_264579 [Daedaleopsis nitida]
MVLSEQGARHVLLGPSLPASTRSQGSRGLCRRSMVSATEAQFASSIPAASLIPTYFPYIPPRGASSDLRLYLLPHLCRLRSFPTMRGLYALFAVLFLIAQVMAGWHSEDGGDGNNWVEHEIDVIAGLAGMKRNAVGDDRRSSTTSDSLTDTASATSSLSASSSFVNSSVTSTGSSTGTDTVSHSASVTGTGSESSHSESGSASGSGSSSTQHSNSSTLTHPSSSTTLPTISTSSISSAPSTPTVTAPVQSTSTLTVPPSSSSDTVLAPSAPTAPAGNPPTTAASGNGALTGVVLDTRLSVAAAIAVGAAVAFGL